MENYIIINYIRTLKFIGSLLQSGFSNYFFSYGMFLIGFQLLYLGVGICFDSYRPCPKTVYPFVEVKKRIVLLMNWFQVFFFLLERFHPVLYLFLRLSKSVATGEVSHSRSVDGKFVSILLSEIK